jgi:hypothetical protein
MNQKFDRICHSERSEESPGNLNGDALILDYLEILRRFAPQDDKIEGFIRMT